MKTIYVVRTKNNKVGNPIYLVDSSVFSELKNIGKATPRKSFVRRVVSYNIKQAICDYLGHKVNVVVLNV